MRSPAMCSSHAARRSRLVPRSLADSSSARSLSIAKPSESAGGRAPPRTDPPSVLPHGASGPAVRETVPALSRSTIFGALFAEHGFATPPDARPLDPPPCSRRHRQGSTARHTRADRRLRDARLSGSVRPKHTGIHATGNDCGADSHRATPTNLKSPPPVWPPQTDAPQTESPTLSRTNSRRSRGVARLARRYSLRSRARQINQPPALQTSHGHPAALQTVIGRQTPCGGGDGKVCRDKTGDFHQLTCIDQHSLPSSPSVPVPRPQRRGIEPNFLTTRDLPEVRPDPRNANAVPAEQP